MLCEYCGKRPGISKTIIQDGKERKVCICRECEDINDRAALKLRRTQPPRNVAQRLTLPSMRCCGCGWTTADYEATGTMGCDQCYTELAPVLAVVLRRQQPSVIHVGKSPTGVRRADEYDHLRAELERAVKECRYQDADAVKKLMDRIRGGH